MSYKKLWEYCLSLQIVLTAEYLTGILNTVIVDQQSRSFLGEKQVVSAQTSIKEINNIWGPLSADILADRFMLQYQNMPVMVTLLWPTQAWCT